MAERGVMQAFRERYGLTQADLAELLGMSKRWVESHDAKTELPVKFGLALAGLALVIEGKAEPWSAS